MKIALASDHAGIELKKGIVSYLAENGIDHQDFGCGPEDRVQFCEVLVTLAAHESKETEKPEESQRAEKSAVVGFLHVLSHFVELLFIRFPHKTQDGADCLYQKTVSMGI